MTSFTESGWMCARCGCDVPDGRVHHCPSDSAFAGLPYEKQPATPGTGQQHHRIPHRCPVCNGSGAVWESLYTGLPTTGTTPCRSCAATGVVWESR